MSLNLGHIPAFQIKNDIVTEHGLSGTNAFTKTFQYASKMEWITVRYTSDAVAGDRQIRLYLLTDADVEVRDIHAGAVQAASLTRHYEFTTGIYRETTFTDDAIQIPIPNMFVIPDGWKLKVADANNVSALDVMMIALQYIRIP